MRRLREIECREFAWATSAILFVSQDSEILFATRACENLFGYSYGEMVGKSVCDLMLPPKHNGHLDLVRQFCDRAVSHFAPMNLQASVDGVRKDGGMIRVTVALISGFLDDGEQIAMALISKAAK